MRKTLIVLATSLALTTISAIPVFAISGKVKETTGHGIVGMWVEVEGGRSGWAKLTGGEAGTSYEKTWTYDTQGKPFKVAIGYGGTPQEWEKSIHSNWIDTDYRHVDFTVRPKMFFIPIWGVDELIVEYR